MTMTAAQLPEQQQETAANAVAQALGGINLRQAGRRPVSTTPVAGDRSHVVDPPDAPSSRANILIRDTSVLTASPFQVRRAPRAQPNANGTAPPVIVDEKSTTPSDLPPLQPPVGSSECRRRPSATRSNANSDTLAPTETRRAPQPVITSALLRRNQDERLYATGPTLSEQLHGSGGSPSRSPGKSSPRRWFLDAGSGGDRQATALVHAVDEIAINGVSDPRVSDGVECANPSTRKQSDRNSWGVEGLGEDADADDDIGSLDRIGELSRQEDEYDFAILLKPSKYEQRLHLNEPDASSMGHVAVTVADSVGPPPSPSVSPSRLAKGKKTASGARELVVDRIRRTGLEIKRLLSLDGRQTLLKVKAPPAVLERGAERLRLRKLRRFDQIWMEFSRELRATFADFDAASNLVRFIDSEKQSVVHALLTDPVDEGGAGLHETSALRTKYVVHMYPLHKRDLGVLRAQWVTYWRESDDEIAAKAAKMDRRRRRRCARPRWFRHALDQPLDRVAQYFGEKVAFHFAWTEMYTRWLVAPSAAGAVLFALQVRAKRLDHPAAPFYALAMALWTAAFLLAWRRQAARLSYRWGTLGFEEAETTRPEFVGDVVTPAGRQYPAWKRLLKYTVTIPVVGTCIAAVVMLALTAFSTRDRLAAQAVATRLAAAHVAKDVARSLVNGGLSLANLRQLIDVGMRADFWFYLLLTPVLYGLLIPALDVIFTKLARRLNDWENHETETQYQSHLILKVFSFRFVHVFASLYYYAFAVSTSSAGAVNQAEAEEAERADRLMRVAIQLASFMITGQVWKHVSGTLIPLLQRRARVRSRRRAANAQLQSSAVFNATRATIAAHDPTADATTNAVIHEQCVRLEQASDKAWDEAALPHHEPFADYAEVLLQFGCVSFFSLAFPLAPLLALVNNVVELRASAFRLCHATQRPLARKASDIGIWYSVLQLMSNLAVLTNCLHLAFTTTLVARLAPSLSAAGKVWVVFGTEHLLLALKGWMQFAVAATPRDVQDKVRLEREHAKHESARAMAMARETQPTGEPQNATTTTWTTIRQRRSPSRQEKRQSDSIDLHKS